VCVSVCVCVCLSVCVFSVCVCLYWFVNVCLSVLRETAFKSALDVSLSRKLNFLNTDGVKHYRDDLHATSSVYLSNSITEGSSKTNTLFSTISHYNTFDHIKNIALVTLCYTINQTV